MRGVDPQRADRRHEGLGLGVLLLIAAVCFIVAVVRLVSA